MTKKIIISFILLIFTFIFNVANSKVFIKAKVNNQIITNIDVKNERNYLLALNPNLRNLSKENIDQYAIDSLINEKIKKIEIMNFVKKLKVDDKFLLQLIKNRYSKLNINTLEEFESFLEQNNLNSTTIREKFTIELIWNDLIYQKFFLYDS